MKRHKFGNTVYDIDLEHCIAYCDNPKPKRPSLYIPADKERGKYLLYLAIHEALHASDFKAGEDKVEHTSKDISRFLWRLGYRRLSEVVSKCETMKSNKAIAKLSKELSEQIKE